MLTAGKPYINRLINIPIIVRKRKYNLLIYRNILARAGTGGYGSITIMS